MTRLMAIAFGLTFGSCFSAYACDKLQAIPMDEMKEYRNKLIETDADPFDRLFAFQRLSCSSDPSIRAYAVQQGLKPSSDDILRNEVLLQAMMQRKQVVMELVEPGDDKVAKEVYDYLGGAIIETVEGAFTSEACISFNSDDDCRGYFLHVNGLRVTVDGNGYDGSFQLTDKGELVGYIQRSGVKMPATIPLT